MQTKEQALALRELVDNYLRPLQKEMIEKGYNGTFTFEYRKEREEIFSISALYTLNPSSILYKVGK